MTPLELLYQHYQTSTGVCTDTRKITKGCLFFALKGGNFNGNQFASEALALGARWAIIDQAQFHLEGQTILVEDVLTTLQQLANHHRNELDIPIIGITGSNGKTTTKELLSVVLKTKYKTHFTQGNLNNHIGVPLTLLAMPLDTQVAIIEMGANHVGEIEFLCKIADPTHGLITNIGKAHLEGFGGVEGIIRGKSELFRHLMDKNGVIFVNGASEPLMNMSKRMNRPHFYSATAPNAYCYGELMEVNPFIVFNYAGHLNCQTQLVGSYNFENILAALAIGKYLGVKTQDALKAVASYSPTNNRSQVLETTSNKILLDAYNANPTSMAAALQNFEAITHPCKVVILGDMFELGEYTQPEHLNIWKLATQGDFHQRFFVGDYFSGALGQQAEVFKDKTQLKEFLKAHPIQDALVLIKGSRSVGLEELVQYL